MQFRFTYKSYQDVRHNTVLYFLPVIYLLSFTFYFFILPISWRSELDKLISNMNDNNSFTFWFKGITNVLFFSIISYFLIEILKIHDHFYDRYIVKWRKYYDRDFILPKLCKPFLSATSSDRFFEEVERNKGKFMDELYYPFVGDDIDKISKNSRTRFYEVITIHWFTQMNEFSFILSFLIINIFAVIAQDARLFSILPGYLLMLFSLYILNWFWKNTNLLLVERATINQINEIHRNPVLLNELKERFSQICINYRIPYND